MKINKNLQIKEAGEVLLNNQNISSGCSGVLLGINAGESADVTIYVDLIEKNNGLHVLSDGTVVLNDTTIYGCRNIKINMIDECFPRVEIQTRVKKIDVDNYVGWGNRAIIDGAGRGNDLNETQSAEAFL
jgi:hypothetical protein